MRKRRHRPPDPGRALPLNRRGPDADVQPRPRVAEIPVPERVARCFPPLTPIRCYTLGECTVTVTREYGRWHLSIAHAARYPTWDEIAAARYRILPDGIWMAMYLPPRSEYINLHRNVFQLIECDPLPDEI